MSAPTSEPRAGAKPRSRWLVLFASVYACGIYAAAVTVANALLPQIQGDLSTSLDQISWIVTASIVAGAIGTPPTAWVAARFGLKAMMVACLVTFTATSALIGTADSLGEIVLWRVCQSLLGAPIIALSQPLVLDAFPHNRRGFALSIWTIGITGGWVLGPTLGAFLAELGTWRLAFLIFGPLGLVGIVVGATCLPRYHKNPALKFDWFGFGSLSIGLAGLQLVLNRGQRLDWFESAEIIAATAVGIAGLYFFTVRSFTTRKPFMDFNVFRDRNFTIGLFITSVYAFISLAPLVLIPTMLQDLRGLEVLTIGLLLVPRGLVQMATVLVIGPFIDRWDPRFLIALGLVGFGGSSSMMASYNLDIGIWNVVVPTLVQGMSMALISVPTLSLQYSTLAPRLRTNAATIVGLAYTIASSIGVSVSVVVLTRSAQRSTEELGAHVVPTNELLRFPQYAEAWDLDVLENLAAIQAEIGQQALMIGYLNVYWMLAVLSMLTLPLVLLIGKRR